MVNAGLGLSCVQADQVELFQCRVQTRSSVPTTNRSTRPASQATASKPPPMVVPPSWSQGSQTLPSQRRCQTVLSPPGAKTSIFPADLAADALPRVDECLVEVPVVHRAVATLHEDALAAVRRVNGHREVVSLGTPTEVVPTTPHIAVERAVPDTGVRADREEVE